MRTGADCPKEIPFLRLPFNHPIWIVFSSGTTGKPKSIYGPGGGIMLMRKVVFGIHSNLDHRDSYLQFATVSVTGNGGSY
jgi:acetoacetyl-CoA synthetase